jgi:hypothetical protein
MRWSPLVGQLVDGDRFGPAVVRRIWQLQLGK